ncbi:hypothetical protein C2L64_16555 [Paraburkholderia hospita]|jgi:hypothetical protein|uniref:Uncharacterized protein n=1 Tax=Paraburkholderia hospita TaxID=169430 RepID=A0AAN1JA83_9BURK|nr:hypothetical protein C2L64_16555 [Paraburkholderia hospita]OUL67820.1 hypothetical protein CA602_52190 [Paraburkholderia hospita]
MQRARGERLLKPSLLGGAVRAAARVAVRNISVTRAFRMLSENRCIVRVWKDFACIRKRS